MDPILGSILASGGAAALTGLVNKLFSSSNQPATPASPMNPVGAPIQKAGSSFIGYPDQSIQFPLRTPNQQKALDQILNSAVSQLQGNDFSFEPLAQQARTRFNQQTIPSIAERFTSMGPGAQRSSAFRNALGNAASGLEENLAALGSQYNLARQGQLTNLLKIGLAPSFENVYMPGSQGALQGTLEGLLGRLNQPGTIESLLSALFAGSGANQSQQMQGNGQVSEDNLQNIQRRLAVPTYNYNPVGNVLDRLPVQSAAPGSLAELQNKLAGNYYVNPVGNVLDKLGAR